MLWVVWRLEPHLENVRLWLFLLNRMDVITVLEKGMWALWRLRQHNFEASLSVL